MIKKIQYSNPKTGFLMTDKAEVLLYYKWLYWSKGVCARDFWNEKMVDIIDVVDVNNAFLEKNLREKEMNDLIRNARF